MPSVCTLMARYVGRSFRPALDMNPRNEQRPAQRLRTLVVLALAGACHNQTKQVQAEMAAGDTKAHRGRPRAAASATNGRCATEEGSTPDRGGGAPLEAGQSQDSPTSWALVSPSSSVRVTLELADLADEADYPRGRRLYYSVAVRDGATFVPVLARSPLGIVRDDANLVDRLAPVEACAARRIDETYRMITGKRLVPHAVANERVLIFANPHGQQLVLQLRAYDDGFAFRYRFPEVDPTLHTVTAEVTGFRVPDGSRGWLMPYDSPGQFTPAYESYWRHDVRAGANSPEAPGWSLPALFRTPRGHYLLLMDTNVNGSYFAAHLEPEPQALVYRLAFPESGEANGLGDVHPTSSLPWATPWRVVMAGTTAAAVVESTLATDLADPSAVEDTAWIRPGRLLVVVVLRSEPSRLWRVDGVRRPRPRHGLGIHARGRRMGTHGQRRRLRDADPICREPECGNVAVVQQRGPQQLRPRHHPARSAV